MTADDPRPAGEWVGGPCTECDTALGQCEPPAFCCDDCLHLNADWEGYTRPAASGGATDGEREAHTRLDDEYVKPRYPVDEPPTYRARCTCGWIGPERYRGITDGDWQQHISVASQADGETLTIGAPLTWLKQRCEAAAPLVVSGGPFVGCQLAEDHDGPHKVEITWTERC